MLKIYLILRENLLGVAVTAGLIAVTFAALVATEIFRPGPIRSAVTIPGIVEGIQQLGARHNRGITYRLRLQGNRTILVNERLDRPRRWVGSEVLVEQATYENGSISYRFID